MENKINTLFDYIKTLSESDLDRIIKFVLGIVFVNQQSESLPDCPRIVAAHMLSSTATRIKNSALCVMIVNEPICIQQIP